MLKKPQKWGLKIWCLIDAVSKYVYDFSVYCGKITTRDWAEPVPRSTKGLAQNVVMGFMHGLVNKGHVVVMDNYFSSIGLFEELASKGKYATRTMQLIELVCCTVSKTKKHSTIGSKGK